jgi:hypothetical protein
MPNEVFISYSSIKDLNGTVTEFHKYLQNEIQLNSDTSITVFLDKESINSGSSWKASLSNALDQCTVFVVLLSPSWLHSEWCRKEYAYFTSQPADRRRMVLPLRWVDTTVQDARSPEEREIVNQLNELQQVNWLQLRYNRDYERSETLLTALGELAKTIADFIKGFTAIVKYPFGFEEKVKQDETRPAILAKRMQQAAILTNFIPTWLHAENAFDPIGNDPSDADFRKIKYELPSFITMSIYDQFSSEYFRSNYDELPEVEAMLADFRSKIQDFNKQFSQVITKDDKTIKVLWGYLLKDELLQLRIAAVKIKEAAQAIFDKSVASLAQLPTSGQMAV